MAPPPPTIKPTKNRVEYKVVRCCMFRRQLVDRPPSGKRRYDGGTTIQRNGRGMETDENDPLLSAKFWTVSTARVCDHSHVKS
jgi:hypothetical protein